LRAASLGFVTPDWKNVVLLPSLRPFPISAPANFAGVAIDHVSGDIWFAEFQRKRIGLLSPVLAD
jgi:hypothetical protein